MRREAVILPELGTGPDQPIVISHWFASRGAYVCEGQRLVEILVGPATFDVPCPRSGLLDRIRRRGNARVRPGSILGYVAVPEPGDPAVEAGPDGEPRRDPG